MQFSLGLPVCLWSLEYHVYLENHYFFDTVVFRSLSFCENWFEFLVGVRYNLMSRKPSGLSNSNFISISHIGYISKGRKLGAYLELSSQRKTWNRHLFVKVF